MFLGPQRQVSITFEPLCLIIFGGIVGTPEMNDAMAFLIFLVSGTFTRQLSMIFEHLVVTDSTMLDLCSGSGTTKPSVKSGRV